MRKKMTHKLSEHQKEEIIKLVREKYSITDIAKKFQVSRITVYNIMRKARMGTK